MTDAIGDNDGFDGKFGHDRRPPTAIYLISPPVFDLAQHVRALKAVLDAAPVAAYQLRLKDVDDKTILDAAAQLQPLCAEHDVAFILNDRADLALKVGADGVHLGQEDGSARDARELLGRDAQIGVTCHDSRHLAMEAGENGADYVAFGAFFQTTTMDARFRATPEIVSWWTAISPIPCVAIGGIDASNCTPLVQAGADFLAVSGAIWNAEYPAAAAVQLHEAMVAAR